MIRVLYVDDEENNLTAFNSAFRRYFDVYTASSAEAGRVILDKEDIHVLITDQRMPDETGTQLLKTAVEKYPDQVRILLTAYADIDAVISAINEGYIFRYLKKPWDELELKESIELAYENYRQLKDLKKREKEYEELLKKYNQEIKEEENKNFDLGDVSFD